MKQIYCKEISDTLKTLTNISDNEIKKLCAFSKIKSIAKGTHFIYEGDTPKAFAFVCQGLFRSYYTSEQGKEFTKGFFAEHTFISSYNAALHKQESYFSIEALEDSVVIVIDFHQWQTLIENSLEWHKVLLFFFREAFCVREAREKNFLLFDAPTRYQIFLQDYPGLEKRIKQHYVASYLGITPVALSRIRKKINL